MIELYSPFGIRHVFLYSINTNIYHIRSISSGNTCKYQQIDVYFYQCEFTNLLRQSTFSYQADKSIVTVIQSVALQTYFIDKMLTEIIRIYFDTVYHTTGQYTEQLLYTICNHNIRFLLS